MSEIDLEYTVTTKTVAAGDPISEVRQLAESVNNLTFGQSRAARIVLDWLDVVAPVQPAPEDDHE